jgi:hypothetical protein
VLFPLQWHKYVNNLFNLFLTKKNVSTVSCVNTGNVHIRNVHIYRERPTEPEPPSPPSSPLASLLLGVLRSQSPSLPFPSAHKHNLLSCAI